MKEREHSIIADVFIALVIRELFGSAFIPVAFTILLYYIEKDDILWKSIMFFVIFFVIIDSFEIDFDYLSLCIPAVLFHEICYENNHKTNSISDFYGSGLGPKVNNEIMTMGKEKWRRNVFRVVIQSCDLTDIEKVEMIKKACVLNNANKYSMVSKYYPASLKAYYASPQKSLSTRSFKTSPISAISAIGSGKKKTNSVKKRTSSRDQANHPLRNLRKAVLSHKHTKLLHEDRFSPMPIKLNPLSTKKNTKKAITPIRIKLLIDPSEKNTVGEKDKSFHINNNTSMTQRFINLNSDFDHNANRHVKGSDNIREASIFHESDKENFAEQFILNGKVQFSSRKVLPSQAVNKKTAETMFTCNKDNFSPIREHSKLEDKSRTRPQMDSPFSEQISDHFAVAKKPEPTVASPLVEHVSI